MDALTLFIILIAVILILASFTQAFSKTLIQHNYSLKSKLLTPAERSFYGVLQQAAGEQFLVFSKVRVADVLSPAKGLSRSHWQTAFNRISAKHFDFVLCEPKDLAIKAVVELDDKSHQRTARKKRDDFLVAICKQASLPCHQFKARQAYSVEEIRQQLNPPPPVNVA